MIDEAVEAVEPVAAAKAVAVRAEIEGPIMVSGDHGALGRVLRNLLDNAIRYSPERATVTIINLSEGARARIEVRDEGTGFPQSFVPHAFERFTQADDSRIRPGGAGLGLAIARTLLMAHEGSISIEAGPGGRVTIELPMSEPSGPEVPLPSGTGGGGQTATSTGGPFGPTLSAMIRASRSLGSLPNLALSTVR